MPVNINEFRNHALVKAAVDALEAAQGRLQKATAALDAAKAEQAAAFAESRTAILTAAAGDAIDAHAGAEKYARATTKAEFYAKMLDEVESQVAQLTAAHAKAEGESWRGVHAEGRRLRLQASRDADTARTALHAAEMLWREGTDAIQAAHASGLPRRFDGQHLGMDAPIHGVIPPATVPTEAAEVALWAALAPEGAAE